ncbi:MAG: nucleotide exchange factor GrpE [Firmicutes bacterium]|nr:nucleotide exchange factor GrpE [Bacillota bacterium]MDH7495008.1 nucleotide exchange factor GrpE [Bacillota bacterium]
MIGEPFETEGRKPDDATGGEEAARGCDTGENGAALEDLLRQETALKEKFLAGWQRAQADLENFKKRVAREQADLRDAVVESVVRDMLPALDSLERAVKHAKTSAADQSIAQGLDLVMGKFLEFLSRQGIRPIPAAGEQFDPMRHEAVLRVATVEAEEGTVLEEIQRGYASERRVVRPALVTVACRPALEGQEGAAAEIGTGPAEGDGQAGDAGQAGEGRDARVAGGDDDDAKGERA